MYHIKALYKSVQTMYSIKALIKCYNILQYKELCIYE